jgi:hypothetical protein
MSKNSNASTENRYRSGLPIEAALALSRKNAAAVLAISTVTLDRLVARGLIHATRACRRPLFSTKELERFLEINTGSGASKGGSEQ